MSLALLFHYLMLNMFRMLVHPSSGACDITTTQLLKHNDPETTTQICTLLRVILQQNYFIFQEQIYQG